MALFAYLIKSNDLSMDNARMWCFNQYSKEPVPPWIDEVTMDTSKDELLSLLKENFNVDGSIDFEFEVGSFCQWHKSTAFSLYSLIQNLLISVDKSMFTQHELELLVDSELLLQTDRNTTQKVSDSMQSFIDSYASSYNTTLNLFMVNMEIERLK